MRLELESLRFKELRGRAKASGVDQGLLEDAADADDPKDAVVAILLKHSSEQNAARSKQGQQQLQGMRLKELRKKAKELDVDEDKLDDAMDADEAKDAVIALIQEAEKGDIFSNVDSCWKPALLCKTHPHPGNDC